jgi:hypothetical protein
MFIGYISCSHFNTWLRKKKHLSKYNITKTVKRNEIHLNGTKTGVWSSSKWKSAILIFSVMDTSWGNTCPSYRDGKLSTWAVSMTIIYTIFRWTVRISISYISVRFVLMHAGGLTLSPLPPANAR